MASLIEGLPDPVAIRCLARVPLGMHRVMRGVCKSWRSVLSSGEIFRLRKEAGLFEEWLYVTSYEPDHVWEAYDPRCDRWHVLPVFPSTIRHLSNFGTAAVGSMLFVVGGGSDDVDPLTGEWESEMATANVWSFDPIRGKWESRAPMLTARAQFGCSVLDGKLIVAGGFSNSRRPIGSAEMYDPEKDKWEPIADLLMVHNSSCSGVVLDSKMHLLHKGESNVQVYDPKLNRWSCFDSWWPEIQGPMAVVKGELYTIANGYVYVIRELQHPALRKLWPEYSYRIGFGVAAMGSDLYVVGGILGPRPESLDIHTLKDVDIWNMESEPPERRGTSMTWCLGTVLGCAVVGL